MTNDHNHVPGKKGKRSYFVDKSKVISHNLSDDISIQGNSEDIPTAEEFIESRFNTLISEMVKREVCEQLSKVANFKDSLDDNLIANLQSEVIFLRNELLSKTKIIELLLLDVQNRQIPKPAIQEPFHQSKKRIKPTAHNTQNHCGFEHVNRFAVIIIIIINIFTSIFHASMG